MLLDFLKMNKYLLLIVRHLLSNDQTSLSQCEETRGERLNLTKMQYNWLMETVRKYDKNVLSLLHEQNLISLLKYFSSNKVMSSLLHLDYKKYVFLIQL